MAWLAAQDADPVRLAINAGLVAVLLLLAALHVTYRMVPNVVVFPAAVAAILVGPAASPVGALAGALAGLAIFGAIYGLGTWLYGRPPLGMGDVKLAVLIGAVDVGAGLDQSADLRQISLETGPDKFWRMMRHKIG